MIKWICGKIRKAYEKYKFYRKLQEMDNNWYRFGGGCFELFPPSFYYTHTEEEIQRLSQEEIAKLKAILENMKKAHQNQSQNTDGKQS